jgi:hypothetical protein
VLKRLKRLLALEDDRPAISPDPVPGAMTVTFDHSTITLHQPDGRRGAILWDELGSVTVATTDCDISDDVFWLLLSHDRSRFLAVPLCAVGERELLMAMQLRLRNFDNDAVIAAMTSVETDHFVVWQALARH